jgi:hypothetical protein
MKRVMLIAVGILCPASGVFAQAPQQSVQCRPLRQGDFLLPNESIVGSGDNALVCGTVMVKPASTTPFQAVPVNVAAVTKADNRQAGLAPSEPPTAVQKSFEPTPQPSPTSTVPTARIADGKTRIYVTDRPISEVISMYQASALGTAHASGNANGFNANYSGDAYYGSQAAGIKNDNRGGADPRTLEVSSDIVQDCHEPNLVVTNNPAAADFILDFRRQGGKRSTFFLMGGLSGLAISSAMKVDHAALYAVNGDLVYATKARSVGGAVKEVCAHLKLAPAIQAKVD